MSKDDITKLLDAALEAYPRQVAGWRQTVAAAREQYEKMRKRIDWLERWKNDLQSGMYINCVYCGHRYPPGTGAVMQDVLYEHIKQCPKHPLAKAEATIAALKQRVEELEGYFVSYRDDLHFVNTSPINAPGHYPITGHYYCKFCDGSGKSPDSFKHNINCPCYISKASTEAVDSEEE